MRESDYGSLLGVPPYVPRCGKGPFYLEVHGTYSTIITLLTTVLITHLNKYHEPLSRGPSLYPLRVEGPPTCQSVLTQPDDLAALFLLLADAGASGAFGFQV